MEEIWESIEGYESAYQISNCGIVRSIDRIVISKNGVRQFIHGVYLKPKTDKDGYLFVHLSKDGEQTFKSIHRLVAAAFINRGEAGPVINHIDGNRTNNTADNLEWCTVTENNRHSIKLRRSKGIPINGNGMKPIIQIDMNGNVLKKWPSIKSAADELGFRNSSICTCCKGRSKTSYGYVWEYA